ncbi:Spore coat protein CotH [Liquorilactobacillus aquaticus DSM 21051]|uniref:Spore coat protein CotH n=1 Tax=Liquorilactobacillus aquaticus DSM 21051 TaxID=1423725 RepID=A0A0R2CVU8_9LACO|nr:CotH kinase family protein [Liquorilactobacillus aquaticus]KRM95949.1 Spore coat protein CotH [Liquorilactobacillus aquaticus DSM 21051]
MSDLVATESDVNNYIQNADLDSTLVNPYYPANSTTSMEIKTDFNRNWAHFTGMDTTTAGKGVCADIDIASHNWRFGFNANVLFEIRNNSTLDQKFDLIWSLVRTDGSVKKITGLSGFILKTNKIAKVNAVMPLPSLQGIAISDLEKIVFSLIAKDKTSVDFYLRGLAITRLEEQNVDFGYANEKSNAIDNGNLSKWGYNGGFSAVNSNLQYKYNSGDQTPVMNVSSSNTEGDRGINMEFDVIEKSSNYYYPILLNLKIRDYNDRKDDIAVRVVVYNIDGSIQVHQVDKLRLRNAINDYTLSIPSIKSLGSTQSNIQKVAVQVVDSSANSINWDIYYAKVEFLPDNKLNHVGNNNILLSYDDPTANVVPVNVIKEYKGVVNGHKVINFKSSTIDVNDKKMYMQLDYNKMQSDFEDFAGNKIKAKIRIKNNTDNNSFKIYAQYNYGTGSTRITLKQFNLENNSVASVDDLILPTPSSLPDVNVSSLESIFVYVQAVDITKNIDFDVLEFNLAQYAVKKVLGNSIQQNTLPVIQLNGDVSSMNGSKYANTSFSFIDKERKINAFAKIEWQGDSSQAYPKKNYKLKLYSDNKVKNKLKVRFKPTWVNESSYVLKANFIDVTEARNICNARIFSKATQVTKIKNPDVRDSLVKAPNYGQMDGFPVKVFLNGNDLGLYTLNLSKHDVSFGMDEDVDTNEAISFETINSLLNTVSDTIDGTNYACEVHDDPTPDLINNFSSFLNFINTSTDNDFKAHLAEYIDIKSVINTYLFGIWAHEWDNTAKSLILLTWDSGKTYYMIPYDLDSTWYLYWNGSKLSNETSFALSGNIGKFVTNANYNVLFKRIYNLMFDQVKEQWTMLRNSVWNNERAIDVFKQFISEIPESEFESNLELWPTIPSSTTNDFNQIKQSIIKRGDEMDAFLDAD